MGEEQRYEYADTGGMRGGYRHKWLVFVLKSTFTIKHHGIRHYGIAITVRWDVAVGVTDPLIQQAESDLRDLHERRYDGESRPGGGGASV